MLREKKKKDESTKQIAMETKPIPALDRQAHYFCTESLDEGNLWR